MSENPSFHFLTVLILLFAALGSPGPADAESPPLMDLFQKGKTEFKLGSYRASLATFELLDASSQRPGHERDRAELAPIIAFYRAANLAALGETEAAVREFEKYLATSPSTRLDPSTYPKKVIATFKKAQDEFRKTSPGRKEVSENSEIAADYARFRTPDEAFSLSVDERWAAGPVRYLLTDVERSAWDRIRDPVERGAFITDFWQKRDPNPSTPENELRTEFEKRVLFADARFRREEKRGSESDQGLVFALLGPPSYVRHFSLSRAEDLSQAARMATERQVILNPDGTTTIRYVKGRPLAAEPAAGTREAWYYRSDRLPSSVKYAEVAFEFLTQHAFGIAVLQREPQVLKTLEEVARSISTK